MFLSIVRVDTMRIYRPYTREEMIHTSKQSRHFRCGAGMSPSFRAWKQLERFAWRGFHNATPSKWLVSLRLES